MPRGPDTRGGAAVFLEDSRASHLEGGTCDKEIPSKTDADVPVVGAAALGRAAARHEAGRASYARPCDDGGGGMGVRRSRWWSATPTLLCWGQGMYARPVPSQLSCMKA